MSQNLTGDPSAIIWTNVDPDLCRYRVPLCHNELFHCCVLLCNLLTSATLLRVIEQGLHYSDIITGAMASQITRLTIVFSIIYSGADQRKQQSSASLAFLRGIHRWPVNSPHKGPVTRKMFPFDDVIMTIGSCNVTSSTTSLNKYRFNVYWAARKV